MTANLALFFPMLFLIAFLYASVGHGGASGYLALMVLFGFAPDVMKPTALALNLFVSLTAFIHFYRGKYFKWSIFLPFALVSIPFSFLGGLISIDAYTYKKILGLLLIIPIIRFLFYRNTEEKALKPANFGLSLLIGSVIGLLSGLIGIGGGIILSPVLLLLKWTNQKQTAAISALFIFVNSLAGLGGQLAKGVNFTINMYVYVAIAFAGGLFGAYFGAMKFSQSVLKNILAATLIAASYKLLFTSA